MSDFIKWNSRLLRKQSIDLVDTGQGYGGASTVLIYFNSGQTRAYSFNSIAERDRKFKELSDKLSDKRVEDSDNAQEFLAKAWDEGFSEGTGYGAYLEGGYGYYPTPVNPYSHDGPERRGEL